MYSTQILCIDVYTYTYTYINLMQLNMKICSFVKPRTYGIYYVHTYAHTIETFYTKIGFL